MCGGDFHEIGYHHSRCEQEVKGEEHQMKYVELNAYKG
jgi:hypothetical protein